MRIRKETGKKIIQAALELFVRNGYHGTSINQITQKIGLSKGALYSHFSSKGELLLQIIEEFDSQYIEKLIKTVSDYEGNALEKLNCAIDFSSKFALENPNLCFFLTFLTMELNADVDFQPALKRVYRKYEKLISDVIKHGISQGLIKKSIDPDMGALTFMAIHDGVLHQWYLNRFHVDGRHYVKTFRTIFMEGFKA